MARLVGQKCGVSKVTRRLWQILGLAVVGVVIGAGACSANGGLDRLTGNPDVDGSTVLVDGATTVLPPGACDGGSSVVIKSLQPGRHLTGDTTDQCSKTINWSGSDDAGPPPTPPPDTENGACPEGQVRIHVRDMWSSQANPTLNRFADRPLAVTIIDPSWNEYGARQESAGCDWYSTCIARASIPTFSLNAVGPDGCAVTAGMSGVFTGISSWTGSDIYIEYKGSNLATDYGAYPQNVPQGPNAFLVTDDVNAVSADLCKPGKPDQSTPTGYTKLHIRWFWGDPTKTGYPGTACGDDKLGFDTPPYPASLKVQGGTCDRQALLEFNNGDCPWYTVLIPNSDWTGAISIRYGDESKGLFSPQLTLPQPRTADEYWLGYQGAPDDTAMFGTACLNWSQRPGAYFFYTSNPGPGYANCGGGDAAPVDPCNPPMPSGYSAVHFRYIWAGQKTFTFFPKPEFMPKWIVLEVNGGVGDNDIICYREANRPWFNCPVPNTKFVDGATWRAVDKLHTPEWNTVAPRPFPAVPGEYWLRWYYGKPDIPATSQFKFFDYYPDGTNGDWSSTANWSDQNCAPKPPPTSVKVGFDYGGWFPYDETSYAYPFGSSLARTFPKPQAAQDLLNAFVFERYNIWKTNYLTTDLTCGADTLRVKTDPPETVSEGQGYGIAMAAAIGDKPTFDKLWNFTRHYLSQSAKKYCGGLMGWMWDSQTKCRALDATCDPDTNGCGGNTDSAFDGDVDIGIGLVFAARQWPEYREAAINWLLKMECEVNTAYDGKWNYPAPGDTWDKNCGSYPGKPCSYTPNFNGTVNLSYYPPGYFRVFGDFLKAYLDSTAYSSADREGHRVFWYKTAETVYEMLERCYDQTNVNPGLVTDWGHYETPCDANSDNYNWSRALWRIAVDAAWFGNRSDLPENFPKSSEHYPPKSRMQAKIDNIQEYYSNFYVKNPPEPNANRFSTICQNVTPDGAAANCDPAYSHNSYFVNAPLCAYVSVFDDNAQTTPDIRREAIEESVSATIENDKYYQESIGVYTMMFLSGNFPNPMTVP